MAALDAGRRVIIERDVLTPMSDGTSLRADVYRPDDDHPHPTLVMRTPYGKDHPMGVTNLILRPVNAVESGFAVVVQDTRGRFASAGEWRPLAEADDTSDTVEWAAGQEWSTGRVGLYGSSYMGVSVQQGAATQPASLRAAVAYLTGSDYHDGWVYSGGALELLFNLRWTVGQALAEVWRIEDQELRSQALRRLQWLADHPMSAMQATPLVEALGAGDAIAPYWRSWLTHPDYDELWAAVDTLPGLARTSVPVLNIAGWYDGFLPGQLRAHAALTAGPGTGHRLIIGPWDHESYQGMRPDFAGEAHFGRAATSGTAGLEPTVLSWFEHWLTEDPAADPATRAAVPGSPVRYFHIGPHRWVDTEQWPPTKATTTTWYLTSEGGARSAAGDGQLSRTAPPIARIDSYLHDPGDPVPTVGGRHLGYWYGRAGVVDQSTREKRSDVLVYTSDELAEDLDVLGPVTLDLVVGSTVAYTDFIATLVDVHPDGYCANVTEGVRRVTDPQSGIATTPVQLTIDMAHTAYRFHQGHRVRLDICSSNFPRFDRNGGVGPNPALTDASDWVTSLQSVYHGPEHPSALHLGGPSTEGDAG